MPGVFPDYSAPVIRNTEGGREMVTMRRSVLARLVGITGASMVIWGVPTCRFSLHGSTSFTARKHRPAVQAFLNALASNEVSAALVNAGFRPA